MKRVWLSAGLLCASLTLAHGRMIRVSKSEATTNLKNIINITTVDQFDAFINCHQTPIVIEAYSATCGACKAIAPTVIELAQQYAQITFVQIEYQQAEDLIDFLDVPAFPTFIFYNNGKLIEPFTLSGPNNKDKLISQVASLA